MAANYAQLTDVANRLRASAIEMTCASKSGHPSSSASAAELVAALFFAHMKYDVKEPRSPSADRFVLSKGHACPILYAAWEEAGLLSREDVLSLRKIDSDVEGHPTPRLSFIDVATGSLGQGLSCAAGMAFVGKYVDRAPYRTFCLLGDGECAEGSVWEAAAFASWHKLDNLVAIVDVNRLGQSQETALGHQVDVYAARFAAFGWESHVVDGHDFAQIFAALDKATKTAGKPTALIARTFKGKGISGVEDQPDWHGKPVPPEKATEIRALIGATPQGSLVAPKPTTTVPDAGIPFGNVKLARPPQYNKGDLVATRLAYGTALAKLGEANSRVIGLDADTKNSTFSDKLLKVRPDQFIECFIAEQNMVGVAIGAGCRGRTIPFCSTFAAFFTRAADQLRMAAVSFANVKCVGSHAGVSIGEDGPSQMALEDLALFRSIAGSVVLYPSDAVSTERATELAANTQGIVFIRTCRPNLPVIYDNDEPFALGKAKVVVKSDTDKVLVVGAGVTLDEARKAAQSLASSGGPNIAVVDLFSVKPIDKELLLTEARRVGGRVLTVEEHYAAGGIGEAVSAALADAADVRVRSLYVKEVPRSGPPTGLLKLYGVDADAIQAAVKAFN